jgi:hypothetical protein
MLLMASHMKRAAHPDRKAIKMKTITGSTQPDCKLISMERWSTEISCLLVRLFSQIQLNVTCWNINEIVVKPGPFKVQN